jgi:hypothetical protein
MREKINFAGMKIGKITIVSFVERKKGKSYWKCKCDCGNEFIGEVHNIKNRIERHGQNYCKKCRTQANITHGDSKKKDGKTRLYSIWQGMRYRCEKEYASKYEYYGGRGIRVCQEWQDYSVFKEWALANGYNDNLTIDRINSDGNYEPSNCQWITRKEQANNTSQVNHFLYKGKSYTMAELSELTGISRITLDARLRKGWPIEKIIETPHRTKAKR